jgi:rhomboid protease GluP
MNSNVEGVYFFYRSNGEESTIVSVLRAYNGTEFTDAQYQHILSRIKEGFTGRGLQNIRLLSLIFTNHPEQTKNFCLEQDCHWIIDLSFLRLLIYETQCSDFMGFRNLLEDLLEEERQNSQQQNMFHVNGDYDNSLNPEFGGVKKTRRIKLITPMNTLIIAVNIIVFLAVEYIGGLGGANRLIVKGGIYWYAVIKEHEYYRIITSLFMHADLSHLLNNMLVLFFVGDNLERAAGKFKYLLLYFGSGIIADITSIVYNMVIDKQGENMTAVYSIGASGAIFGVVGAMLYVIIRNKGRLEDISSRQIILFVVFSFYGGITNVGIDNAAHFGGFISGLLLAILLYRKPKAPFIKEPSI